MGRKVQLNYDELRTFVKKFRDEGEDIVQMHSKMRDRVHDLHKDWVGESADKFFNEMENDVLPALVTSQSMPCFTHRTCCKRSLRPSGFR